MTSLEHKKTYYAKELSTANGTLLIEGPISPEVLASLEFHEGLKAFRPAPQQHQAMVEIAGLPEGRIIIARQGKTVVGYVTYVYPDPLERWSEARLDDLLELGAIEVVSEFRSHGVAKALLEISFMDDAMNDYIVISTEYYWHWDLKDTGLTVWEYKEVMRKVMGSVGMEVFSTDDPEITCHPANMLMARIGSRVPQTSIDRFNKIRFKNKNLF
ncbi:GNAT family N-acetyltransferase [Effusibacillus dendaii]|uniref:Acetoin utilization protein AcuA n=1 Tax=Effusibacillus dendaii TaxID=2743772 RepID=A0A7I8DED3_9BACL|nr:GNAT family N-acetyltransferase [Effusibacillus dendaii]BCJ88484.1 acetoin utilization protein AcuA [Effusibacillus dendaii]